MQNKKLHDFLEGELSRKEISDAPVDSVEKDFVDSYEQLITDSKTEIPEFNAFERIEEEKRNGISFVKRFLPYAALLLAIISTSIVFLNQQTSKDKSLYTEQELLELQRNTEIALVLFSRELNSCMTQLNTSLKKHPIISSKKSTEHFNIEFKNPLKNLNINQL